MTSQHRLYLIQKRSKGMRQEPIPIHGKISQITVRYFCDSIKAEGYDAMIYANMKWMAFTLKLEELEGYDFWYADYHEEPQCPYAFKMWQYSETGEVPGITGHVDLDLWFQEEN